MEPIAFCGALIGTTGICIAAWQASLRARLEKTQATIAELKETMAKLQAENAELQKENLRFKHWIAQQTPPVSTPPGPGGRVVFVPA